MLMAVLITLAIIGMLALVFGCWKLVDWLKDLYGDIRMDHKRVDTLLDENIKHHKRHNEHETRIRELEAWQIEIDNWTGEHSEKKED